jgi:hypothetical protein
VGAKSLQEDSANGTGDRAAVVRLPVHDLLLSAAVSAVREKNAGARRTGQRI